MLKFASKFNYNYLRNHIITKCDDGNNINNDDDGINIDFDDENLTDNYKDDEPILKKTPIMQYDTLYSNVFSRANVNTYDGFRTIVQKQVNLNTVVSHFYWLGSQNLPNPLYQYRIILPFADDKVINVATDLDFNVEGEIRYPIISNKIQAKTNFQFGEHKNLSVDIEVNDDISATQIKYTIEPEAKYQLSYIQNLFLPSLLFGGMGNYNIENAKIDTSYSIIYNPENYLLAVQLDRSLKMIYLRKVNPNRVHLSTDLTIDEKGECEMSLSSEFFLKQSKLQMGIDSNLLLKSYLETNATPTTQLQFSAEICQPRNFYRFGFGICLQG